jgi:hypothetical protein
MITYNQYIDQIKLDGFRPCIIGAITCNGKIGLLRSNKYPGYEFVQGGIGFGETPVEAIEREVIEEMGFWFHKECNFPPRRHQFLFEDKMQTKVKEVQVTSSGEEIQPKGKHYLVYGLEINPVNNKLPEINSEDFQFKGSTVKLHSCKWVSVKEALELVQTLQNQKKEEIATRAIKCLEDLGYAS